MSGRALAAVAALMFLPGAGAAFALWKPGEASLATRLGVMGGLGYSVTGLLSFLLTVTHQLFLIPFLVLLCVATVALWYVALRRSSVQEHLRSMRDEIREDPWSLALGLVVLAAIAVVRLGFTSHVFIRPVGFRYWADGLEFADNHGITRSAIHYGAIYAPTTSKVVLNSFNATLSLVVGRDPIQSLPPALWAVSVGLASALWALGRELGLRFVAPLLPVLLITNEIVLNDELTKDMTGYKAEVFGRLVAVTALVLAVRALRRGASTREAIAAGVLFAVAIGTHLIPVLITIAILVSFSIAFAFRTADIARVAKRGLIIIATAGGAGLLVLILPRGEIGFGGAVRSADYDRFRQTREFDPTTFLVSGSLKRALRPGPQGPWYFPPGYLFQVLISEAVPLTPSGPTFAQGLIPRGVRSMPVAVGVAVGALALAVVIFVWFPPVLRPLGLTALGLGVFLFCISLLFSFRYDVYILARFGLRRMADYGSLPVVILGLTVLEAALLGLKRLWPFPALVGGTLVVAVFAAVIIPSARPDAQEGQRGDRVVAALQQVTAKVPCSARILASVRTSGTFEATTGRVAVLEGMAPYLRPAMLEDAVRLLRSADAFFRKPSRHRQFLRDRGVDVVVVFDKAIPLGFLTQDLNASATQLARAPFLRESYRSRELRLFEVTGLRTVGSFPSPAGRPGYRCVVSASEAPAP